MNRTKLQSLWITAVFCLGLGHAALAGEPAPPERGRTGTKDGTAPVWEACGWGGGGLYWSAVFHPTQDGTIYMGGDVGGVYKTEDHGRHWRMINHGLTNYAVYSLAVGRKDPQTVFAATVGGLCKSTDGGEHWQLLPKTGPKDLRITAERDLSVRAIAVGSSDSNVVYAGSPAGKIYKSQDGGQTWKQVYQIAPPAPTEPLPPPTVLRAQFGEVNSAFHGGFWTPLAPPPNVKAADCQGFGFSFKGNGAAPKTAILSLWTSDGAMYNSRNLQALFEKNDWQEVVLTAEDFTLDPNLARKQPEKAKSLPKLPDWTKANRVDFCCVNMQAGKPSIGLFGKFYFTAKGSQEKLVAKDFTQDKTCHTYGNVSTEGPKAPEPGTVFSVAVAEKNPAMVLAATAKAGVLLSEDRGETWQALSTPQKAFSVAAAATDPSILLGAFGADGIWKSTDKGKTWAKSSTGVRSACAIREVAISPANTQDAYAIGWIGWDGCFYASNDGGKTWQEFSRLAPDRDANPTLAGGLSRPTNLAINPANPRELFLSANWRPCLSEDGGHTWTERDRGADITCFTDIRFHGNRVYASAMDEGELVSEDNGKHWRQLWPVKYDTELSGHIWQQAIGDNNGQDRIITTCSPWDAGLPNRVVISEDGGSTFKVTKSGLPDYRPTANTMWGMSYPRGLVVDPANPKVLYLGMDGDATEDKCGGGIFKSEDGGYTWKQPASQPGSRRCFYGLAIDPTDSKRLFWGGCGEGGGLYRSEDAGESWQHVFKNNAWVWRSLVTTQGVVYCAAGWNLYRSEDHGQTWKQLTRFAAEGPSLVGLEVDPRDPKTVWISSCVWGDDAVGGVYKTSDGGATWQDITGDLPYRKPTCLRFNPATGELWAAGVGAFKLKQGRMKDE